jgi:hypothetical protein
MPRKKGKKKAVSGRSKKWSKSTRLDPLRAGMPSVDSITGVEQFKTGKGVLNVIHTNEVDAYEAPPKSSRKKR